MGNIKDQFDGWSWVVIHTTLILFVAALFEKGLTHDLLLEAGVFLVSVKLILMSYKNGVTADSIQKKLGDIQAALARLEGKARYATPEPGAHVAHSTFGAQYRNRRGAHRACRGHCLSPDGFALCDESALDRRSHRPDHNRFCPVAGVVAAR